jgi:hypothetical protein
MQTAGYPLNFKRTPVIFRTGMEAPSEKTDNPVENSDRGFVSEISGL